MNNRANEERLAYKMADEKFKELIEKLEKYNNLFHSFDFDTIDRELRGEEFEDVIIARSRVVEAASVACELFGKYLLLTIGKTWGDLKRLGHNLSNLYNALDDNQRAELDRTIFYMYNAVGGDLKKLGGMINKYRLIPELVSNKNYFDETNIDHGKEFTVQDDFYKDNKIQSFAGIFTHMMSLITGTLPTNSESVKKMINNIDFQMRLNDVSQIEKLKLFGEIFNSENSPVLEEINSDMPNIGDLFAGSGQPLGVRARYTQDLLKDLKQEEILFLISMAYGLSGCAQKVYEASKQQPTNGG